MTERQAETIANLLLGAAVAGASYYILTAPVLRRAAWQLARTAMAAAGPWLAAEVRRAWADSGARAAPREAAPRQEPAL